MQVIYDAGYWLDKNQQDDSRGPGLRHVLAAHETLYLMVSEWVDLTLWF